MFKTISGYFIIEILVSFFLILILFKIFVSEITYFSKKTDMILNLKQYNNVYYTLHYISNKLFGIQDTYKKTDIFKGRKNSLLFSQFFENKFNKLLKHKNIYYFYWDNFKIKETFHIYKNKGTINCTNPRVLCKNISFLQFLYCNNLCLKWKKNCLKLPKIIKISINFFLSNKKKYVLFTVVNTSIK